MVDSSNGGLVDVMAGMDPAEEGSALAAALVRSYGRGEGDFRPVRFTPDFQEFPLASVLVEMGRTRVAVGVWMEEKARPWLAGTGKGWVTAEYGMLPGATCQRFNRESATGRVSGRSQEIQRLIGRSLRMALDLDGMAERTLRVDCDVIQADGGTRTASITGGYVALALACGRLVKRKVLSKSPIIAPVAAISCGITEDGRTIVDLDYKEDSGASADINFVFRAAVDGGVGEVMTPELVEIQGTAESRPFPPQLLNRCMEQASVACTELFLLQRAALEAAGL